MPRHCYAPHRVQQELNLSASLVGTFTVVDCVIKSIHLVGWRIFTVADSVDLYTILNHLVQDELTRDRSNFTALSVTVTEFFDTC